jgi:hypothetical protein
MALHSVMEPEESGQAPTSEDTTSPTSRLMKLVGELLAASPLAREQFQQARHDQARADLLDGDMRKAKAAAEDADARVIAERHKAGQHQRINRKAGSALAALLAIVDVVPAYWSAQAFNLDKTTTFVLTGLLCAALGGAMWLLDLFADKGKRLAVRALGGALVAGFAVLLFLRFQYLEVVGGDGPISAATQAAALTGLSAALVTVGFVLLSHRKSRAMAAAERLARRTGVGDTENAATAIHAEAAMSRAAFEDTVVSWVLAHEPGVIGHEQLMRAMDDAITLLIRR